MGIRVAFLRRKRSWQMGAEIVALTVAFAFIGLAQAAERIRQKDDARQARLKEESLLTDRFGPMVLVPAGEFIMGDNHGDGYGREKPSRRVYLDAFYIDKYLVTNDRFRLAGMTPARTYEDKFNGPNQPVVGVTWSQADEYCRKAGKRLPTEAEWEKAARGVDGRKYPWGNEWLPQKLIWEETGRGKTHPVDRPYHTHESPYGAVDMAGNVWQWVSGWYDENYYGSAPDRNPQGPASGKTKVLRGGSWWSRETKYLRVSYRNHFSPLAMNTFWGFRCAKALN